MTTSAFIVTNPDGIGADEYTGLFSSIVIWIGSQAECRGFTHQLEIRLVFIGLEEKSQGLVYSAPHRFEPEAQ
jgi:hypothetical protein